MTETIVPALSADLRPSTSSATRSLWKGAGLAALAGGAAVTLGAAVASAADVPRTIGGEEIPLLGFPQLVAMCTVVGTLIALAIRARAAAPRSTWTRTAVVLTVLSCIPDLTIDASPATKLVLAATHVVAAAVVIPMVAARLPERRTA